jgi:hypothetical protein
MTNDLIIQINFHIQFDAMEAGNPKCLQTQWISHVNMFVYTHYKVYEQ